MLTVMARGRSHRFLDHWHKRSIELSDGSTLSWTLIDDPVAPPHAENFHRTERDGSRTLVHAIDGARLLGDVKHPDVEFVRIEPSFGGRFH